jgi:hypothetical protein
MISGEVLSISRLQMQGLARDKMELYLPPVFKTRRAARPKINWTEDMIRILCLKFPYTFNRDLAKELGISMSSMHCKARELGIKKEDGFLDKNRSKITILATAVLKITPHPGRGVKGWCVPNSENTRFRTGQKSIMAVSRDVVEKCRSSRNETIRRERFRIGHGLLQKTRLNLKAY